MAALSASGGASAGGCAPSLRVMAGSVDRTPLAVTARVISGNEAVRLALGFENHSDDPVAVDLDRVVVRAASGDVLRVLGKTQRVRGALGGEVQRVPLDAIVIDPHGKAQTELELPALPGRGPASLQLPALHRLGIEGQRPLPPIQIPLQYDEAASRQTSGMFDPFEE